MACGYSVPMDTLFLWFWVKQSCGILNIFAKIPPSPIEGDDSLNRPIIEGGIRHIEGGISSGL